MKGSDKDVSENGVKQQEICEEAGKVKDGSKKPLSKKQIFGRALRAALIVLLALAIVPCAAVIGLYLHYYSMLDTNLSDSYSYLDYISFSDIKSSIELPEEDIYTDENVTNILIIGTDEITSEFDDESRAESLMVLSLDSRGAVRVVTLNPDITVRIDGTNDDLLSNTFRYGGAELVLSTIKTHFNIEVEKYIRINMSVLEPLVDALGGVDIELTEDEAAALNEGGYNSWGDDNEASEGVNHFDGKQLLEYANIQFEQNGDQSILYRSIWRELSGLSLRRINSLLKVTLPYLQTNLNPLELAGVLVESARIADMTSETEWLALPQEDTYFTLAEVDFTANCEVLRDFLYADSSSSDESSSDE